MNINQANICGRVTKKPELRVLPSGNNVTKFSIATNYTYKDQSGTKKEETEFHNVVAFGKTAETICQWVEKGQELYVQGRIKTNTWEKDGEKKYVTEIIIENFQFGQKPKNDNQPYKPQSVTEADYGHVVENKVGGFDEIDYPEENPNLEDIPFN